MNVMDTKTGILVTSRRGVTGRDTTTGTMTRVPLPIDQGRTTIMTTRTTMAVAYNTPMTTMDAGTSARTREIDPRIGK